MINIRDILGKIGGAGRNIASGAKDVLIGTLRNMSPAAVGKRYQAVDDARRQSNIETVRQALGPGATPESIEAFMRQHEGDPLMEPVYTKAMRPFAERLLKARGVVQ